MEQKYKITLAVIAITLLISSLTAQTAFSKVMHFPPPHRTLVSVTIDFTNAPAAVPYRLPSIEELLPVNDENIQLLRQALGQDVPVFYEKTALPELKELLTENTNAVINSTLWGFNIRYEHWTESMRLEIFREKQDGLGWPQSESNPKALDSAKKALGLLDIRFNLISVPVVKQNFGEISPWLDNQTDFLTILANKTLWTLGTFEDELQGASLYLIRMDMLDERASRITISYVKDGMEHQLTKYWIEQELPYWVSNSLSIRNTIGEPLQKLESGKTMMLTAKLNGNTGAGFVHLMQVKNADGITEQLTWTISEPFDGSWQVSYSLIPTHKGEYTIESFVWRSTQGTPLGDVAEQTITVT